MDSVDIYQVIISICVLVGWFGILSKKIDKNLYYIVYAVTISFLNDWVSHYFKVKFHSNIWVMYIENPFEYTLFSLFVYHNTVNKFLKKFIWFSVIIFFTYLILNAIFAKDIYPSTFLNVALKGIGLTCCTIMYIRSLFVDDYKSNKLNISVLIIITGMLFYFSFSALFFSIYKYLTDTPEKYRQISVMRKFFELRPLLAITNIVMYSSITIALFIAIFKKDKPAKNGKALWMQ